jgi:putative ABC transport system substrate-binding protein
MTIAIARRDFVIALGGAAAWPLAARAQQANSVQRIAMLVPFAVADTEAQEQIGAFRQELRRLGWTEGGNIRIDDRWTTNDQDHLHRYAAELVNLKPNVILGYGTPPVAALQQATRTIPIVFVNANDPVGFGFVKSIARPGGNITGFVSFEPAMGGKWLETLREIAPGVARVALIYNPQTHTGQHFPSIETASQSLAVNLVRVPFHDAAEIERRIDDFAREPNGGLLVLPDNSTNLHRDLIVRLAGQHRLPAIYPFHHFVTSGGLAFYGTNTTDILRRSAEYVDRILKGANPADLPVQAPTGFQLIINLKTAKAIGLTVPPLMLTRADDVIE